MHKKSEPEVNVDIDIIPLNYSSDVIPNFWVYGTLCKNKAATIQDFKDKDFYATGVHINNNMYNFHLYSKAHKRNKT